MATAFVSREAVGPRRGWRFAAVAAALLVRSLLTAAPARASELTLLHSWSNESEIAALRVYVKAFEARGHSIIELSAPHEQAGLSPLVSLILAGHPPNVFAASQTSMYREIRDRGLGQTLGEHFRRIGAWEKFPPIVREVISIDGEARKIPTGIHVDGMLYYNTKVAAAAGVDPLAWRTLDDMFADISKVQQAEGLRLFKSLFYFFVIMPIDGNYPEVKSTEALFVFIYMVAKHSFTALRQPVYVQDDN